MANPILNEAAFKRASGSQPLPPPDLSTRSWGAPTTTAPAGVMTVNGTVQRTLGLLVLLMAGAYVGWGLVKVQGNEVTSFPTWTIILVLGGFVGVIVAGRKPHLSPIIAPIYAVVEGIFVGAISRAYETWQDGIVFAAIGATLGVFSTMLLLYRFRIIKVTQRLRSAVIGATMGLMVFYAVSLVVSLFGGEISIINSPSWLGIGFSVLAAGLAAFNLLLNFDTIERGAQAQAPSFMNWFAALGLLVTIVWLYLELLRLLSKLQRN